MNEPHFGADSDVGKKEASVPFDEEPRQPWDDHAPTDMPAHDAAPASALNGLSLELTVRAGDVSFTLDEMQRLAPGSVVGITGIAPGEATLCHGERVVAHGELVDVDGRLGLRITRVVFDR
ncbi:Type III secretion system protein (plasmid) [Pseudomonas antarctica]|uniref:Type III secretion system protein n=1 Tax=Pseudomonas antarctica TaxID=219572 RepID=A0A172ZB26_9PSED|nr:FliM/FliN family flagellar motor switch protein [Pseudomonas antarctica]ANF89269.1 Type III secretion system protein [Pseudomonas antarctica]